MGYYENNQQQQQQQPQQQQQGYNNQQQGYNNQQNQAPGYGYNQPQQQQQQQQQQNYQWDNFMNYLQSQPPPPEKPEGGVCSQCKSNTLEFHDDGRGYCPSCGREFWWDKERAPKEEMAKSEAKQKEEAASYYGEEYEAQIMDRFLEEQLPPDEDLALLEQMRRVGILYREQRITWAEFKEKMDTLKAEFKG